MNKMLAFIESMGRDARLAESPASELASAARAAGVEPRLAEALARRDHAEFRRLLPALLLSFGLALPLRGYAMVAAPDEQPQDEQESAPEEEEKPAESAPAESAPADDAAPPEPEIESDTSDEEGEADDSSASEATDDAGDEEEEEAEDPGEDSDSSESDDDDDDFMLP